MILLTVFLTFLNSKLSTSISIYSADTNLNLDHGIGLNAYQQLGDDAQGSQYQSAPTIAYLMPMTLFDQSAALSQGSLPDQDLTLNQQHDDADLSSYLDDKTLTNDDALLEDKEEEVQVTYGCAGTGVGALNLGDAGPAVSSQSSGPAINSYGHSSSGSSDWVPIKNPHRHY